MPSSALASVSSMQPRNSTAQNSGRPRQKNKIYSDQNRIERKGGREFLSKSRRGVQNMTETSLKRNRTELFFIALPCAALALILLASAHGQTAPIPEWFCTTASDSVPQGCFEPKNIQLVIPVDRYLDLASGSYVQMVQDDWNRFMSLYPIPGLSAANGQAQ